MSKCCPPKTSFRRVVVPCTCLFASILFGKVQLAAAVADEGQTKAPAESRDHASDNSSIQFRRIYVPADKIDVWPRNGEKYIPVESRDFDRWVRLANDSDSSRSNSATIDFAEYTGSLESDRRLSGEGRWTIVLRGDKPAFLPLDNLSIVLRNAHWQDAPQQPVRLGLWGKSDRTPTRFGLEVARTGVLVFDWHVQSHASDDQVEIPWRVPTANSQRLALDLPESRELQLDGGVLLESKGRPRDNKAKSPILRRWLIAFNSYRDANLRILNTDRKIPATPAKIALRENLNYHAGPRGLDISATWQLTHPAEQKQELILAVPPAMQLTSLKVDGCELAWRIQRDSSAPSDLAIIELPAGDPAKPLEIVLGAWQPLVTGEAWRLPRLRPEGVLWTAGNFELSVDPAYELERVEPTDCLETGSRPLPSSADAPESHSFTAYTKSAAVEIMIKRRLPDATVRTGSSLSLADPDLNGRLVTQWNLAHGATHELIGKLATGWLIEAVETIPADAMAEWFVDRHGGQRQLEIQLSRAASAARNVSVIITGRLQRFSLAEPLPAETLRMVTWENALSLQHLLSFQSNEPYALQPVGSLPEVADDTLDDNDRELLTQTPGNRIFDLTHADKNAGLQLSFKPAQYAGQIELEIIDVNGAVDLEYRLIAQPASTPLNHLIVYSSRSLGKDVRWTDKLSNAPIRAEKLAGADAERLNLPKEGEAWLLRFSQQSARSVEISVSASAERSERFSVPLLSLPDATEQHGHIRVRCRSQTSLWLEPVQLETVPLPAEARSSSELNLPPICAAYRYEPADYRDVAQAPKLWVDPIPDVETSLLTARHIHLESFFWPDGRGTHSATFQLENRGAAKLELPLPAGARLMNASLDGHSLALAELTDHQQPAAINFPSQAHLAKLSLYFETRNPPLTAGTKLNPPLVLDRLPFLAGDWVICLPDEYAAEGGGLGNASTNFNWRRRLFGILGRPNEARPFNPLIFDSSVPWTNPSSETNAIASQADTSQKLPQKWGDLDKNAIVSHITPTAVPAPGWHRYSEPFIAGGPAPIIVMHPPATTAWTVFVLLVFFLCGRWMRRSRSEVFALALALAAGIALVVPNPYADPASGAVLGLMLSLLAEWSLRPIAAEGSSHPHRIKTAIARATTVAIAIGLSKFTLAQSPKAQILPQDVSSSAIQRILIPIDAEGRQSGSKFYVSESFLRALISADSDSTYHQGQWLLRDAAIAGELREDAGRTNIVAGDWVLTFSIETLTRDTTILLPLDRAAADWSKTSMLDGVPQPLVWRDGNTCAVKVAEPGRYSLSVACLPKTTTADGRNQLELAVPRVPGTKVELRFPENTTGLDLPNAIIQPPRAGSANRLDAVLDSTGKLIVCWSRGGKQEGGKQGFSIAALHWLNITPTKTELTVKYVVEGGPHRPDSFTVAYDDRWKLVSDDKSAVDELRNAKRSGPHAIRVPILPNATDRQEVLLRWRLAESTALGNFCLPPVELTSAPENKHWLAVSVDPSLEIEIPDSSASDGTVNEFISKWGPSAPEATPQLVLSNFDPNRAWTIAIRPHEMETGGEETLNVAAGLSALRVMYEVKATPGNFAAYRLELSVPGNLSVQDLVATEEDRAVPLRWSRSADNRVSIFFGHPLAKPYRLVLDGSIPIDARAQASLPHISTWATKSATQKIRLYRDDDVHVDLKGLLPSTESKAEPIDRPPPDWVVRPVTVCYLDNNLATVPRVVVAPNALKVSGETLTALTVEGGAWWANYRCGLVVEDGALDVLPLRFPNIWSGPFDVQSSVPVTTDVKPIDEQTGMLSIRFATAVTKGSPLEVAHSLASQVSRWNDSSRARNRVRCSFTLPPLSCHSKCGRFTGDRLDRSGCPPGEYSTKTADRRCWVSARQHV